MHVRGDAVTDDSTTDRIEVLKARRDAALTAVADRDAAIAARGEEINERTLVQRERFQAMVEARQTEARAHQNRRRGQGG
jgi:hypothetical protein